MSKSMFVRKKKKMRKKKQNKNNHLYIFKSTKFLKITLREISKKFNDEVISRK